MMNKFGIIKSKILLKLTESYQSKDMNTIKKIVKLIKSNNNFKELYNFYENVENMYFDNKEYAELFLEQSIPFLSTLYENITPFLKQLDEELGDIKPIDNLLYEDIDIISEKKTLSNINRKVEAKKRILEHLLTKKTLKEPLDDEENTPIITNESLLYSILTNNFNVLYDAALTEEEKNEFKIILKMTDADVKKNIKIIREELLSKIEKLLVENKSDDFSEKLKKAQSEINIMSDTKINYFKLKQLKEELI
jgi:hypothetical protein